MPIFNGWIIRALAVRLRQPEMGPQRRFLLIVALVLALFLIGALWYLFQRDDVDLILASVKRKEGAGAHDFNIVRMCADGQNSLDLCPGHAHFDGRARCFSRSFRSAISNASSTVHLAFVFLPTITAATMSNAISTPIAANTLIAARSSASSVLVGC